MKKVLSLVLAAAMTLGIAATSFADMPRNETWDSTNSTMSIVKPTNGVTESQIGKDVGTTAISKLEYYDVNAKDWLDFAETTILAGSTKTFRYHVVAVANEKDAKNGVLNYNHWNFLSDITVKGPAEVSKDGIKQESFKWNTMDDGKTYLSFNVEFTLKATNTGAVDFKGLVVNYGVKTQGVSNRSGLKKGSATNKNILVGYNNQDINDLYDAVVNAFEDMNTYGESNFDVALGINNPVIPSSVVRFLAKNLGAKQTATFVMSDEYMTSYNDENAVTYFDGTTTLTFDLKAFKDLNNGKHVNVATDSEQGGWEGRLDDIVPDEGRVFNFVTHRDVTVTVSLQTIWNNDDVHVYLLPDDGSTPVPVDAEPTDDYAYGDVVFTGPMGRYLIVYDGELNLDDWGDDEPGEDNEPIEDDNNGLVDEDGNQIENNPGTGSSNAISLAVAMAVVSLAAAGLVVTKKASK